MAAPALADPCGMVPPIYTGQGRPIERVGLQKTYVFYKDGVETIAIRPGFSGKVDEFGMLIPFPSPPALRKLPDEVFGHIAAAVDPPEVVMDLRWEERLCCEAEAAPAQARRERGLSLGRELQRDQVRVLREEALGMYDVAVLEAGSARALSRWMTQHGYRYPDGMDAVCEDYVAARWCFVAVKARVGRKKAVDPKPGMREADPTLPDGMTFDGHVQAMGFRFRTKELVVPMRLSVYNPGDLRNIVYLLTEGPRRIEDIPSELVVRQVTGAELYRNLTAPLPVRIYGLEGKADEAKAQLAAEWFKAQRNPTPHNGVARDLFAGDLLAARLRVLSHEYEELEKTLLRISEELGLRGQEIDALHQQELATLRERVTKEALQDLFDMTLTVIDGDFPREVLARQNLGFVPFAMDEVKNTRVHYDARLTRGAGELGGVRVRNAALRRAERKHSGLLPELLPDWLGGADEPQHASLEPSLGVEARLASRVTVPVTHDTRWLAVVGLLFVLGGLRAKPGTGRRTLLILVSAGLFLSSAVTPGLAEDPLGSADLIERLSDPELRRGAFDELEARGPRAVPHLVGEALEGQDVVVRGWCVALLARIGGDHALDAVARLNNDPGQPMLVRTWAAAARVALVPEDGLHALAQSVVYNHPAVARPLVRRLLAAKDLSDPGALVGFAYMWQSQFPHLAAPLNEAVLRLEPHQLADVLTRGADQQVRRGAAAFLATQALQGQQEAVAAAVARVYRFRPGAETAAWEGGPLFVPGMSWEGDEACALVRSLISWMLWGELHERGDVANQVQNNLWSMGPAQAAWNLGSRNPYGGSAATQWVRAWAHLAGLEEARMILAEQGALGSHGECLEGVTGIAGATGEVERITADRDSELPAQVTRIGFDADPQGEPLRLGQDVSSTFAPLGVTLETSLQGASVCVDGYTVTGRSRGMSCATGEPYRWQGMLTARFCEPGKPERPASVTHVGVWVAAVSPGGTSLQAYDAQGKVIGSVTTLRSGSEYLALRSETPIAFVRVIPNEQVDRDYTIDDLVFDTPQAR
jgi:hypothetical protein